MTEVTAAKKTPKKGTKSEGKDLFAVFATGGKQYRAGVGELVRIEKLPGDFKEGDTVTFDSVLMTDLPAQSGNGPEVTLGTPFIKGVIVTATINKIGRNKTIDVIKYKQKSRYFKKYGHRQPFFEVKIESIK